jgi:hypothetical protein
MIWFFDRAGERVRYEIRRAASQDAYELALTFPDGRTQVEQTPDAAELLERCAELARALRQEGWRASHRDDRNDPEPRP